MAENFPKNVYSRASILPLSGCEPTRVIESAAPSKSQIGQVPKHISLKGAVPALAQGCTFLITPGKAGALGAPHATSNLRVVSILECRLIDILGDRISVFHFVINWRGAQHRYKGHAYN